MFENRTIIGKDIDKSKVARVYGTRCVACPCCPGNRF